MIVHRLGLNTTLLVNIAAIAVATVVFAANMPMLLGAALSPRLGDEKTVSLLSQYLAVHDTDLVQYQQRFNGRSVFFKPIPPRPKLRPPPAPVEIVKAPPEPPPPPPIPEEYTGPSIVFVLGNEVWFTDGLTLSVGEEDQGVKVLSCDPPWTVRLAHAGGEYDVVLLERSFPGFETASREPQPTPGIVRVAEPDLKPLESPASSSRPEPNESRRQ
ncbi:MAG: hypothetical protein O7F17_10800 [Planctomycetota bacterium]|nr:hypothetical protein [Planctomycetota bacterium]